MTTAQVGWYCPGGHLNHEGKTVGPSIRLDDPCAYGVPVYAELPASESPRAVDLRADGVLWAINKAVFHPRGFALAVDTDTGALSLMGDGSEPWAYEHSIEFEPFAALLARAVQPPAQDGGQADG